MSDPAELDDELATLVGRTFEGRYRLDALLGAGGMGAVFRAHHTGLGQDVALKVLRPDVALGKTATARFEREARSASRLDHPNCVRVTDFGELDDGTKYLVMQLLTGSELKDKMGQPWAPLEAIDVTLQILDGLEHAHANGIVHRDLKPENVFLTTDHRGETQVKLVDFGIAKIVEGDGANDKLTRTGMVFGTPRYMSPEQAAGGKVDARTDLYAVGLILYELLMGVPPFVAEDTASLLRMHILQPPPPLPVGFPSSLNTVVNRLLEKSRMDRYDETREAVDALRAARAEVAAGPVLAAGAMGAAAGAAAAGSMAGSSTAAPGTRASGMYAPAGGVPADVLARLTAEGPPSPAPETPTAQLNADGTGPHPAMSPAHSLAGDHQYSASAMTVPTGPVAADPVMPGSPAALSGVHPSMAATVPPVPHGQAGSPRRGAAIPWLIAGGALTLLALLIFGAIELAHLREWVDGQGSDAADSASRPEELAVAGLSATTDEAQDDGAHGADDEAEAEAEQDTAHGPEEFGKPVRTPLTDPGGAEVGAKNKGDGKSKDGAKDQRDGKGAGAGEAKGGGIDLDDLDEDDAREAFDEVLGEGASKQAEKAIEEAIEKKAQDDKKAADKDAKAEEKRKKKKKKGKGRGKDK